MTRVFVNGVEVDVTFTRDTILVTEAASDYVCELKIFNGVVSVSESKGISPEGKEVSNFIFDHDIISETDPEFWDKYLKVW